MSALGQKVDLCGAIRHVRFTPNSDIDCVFQHVRFGPEADICNANRYVRFIPKSKHHKVMSRSIADGVSGAIAHVELAMGTP